MQDRLNILKLVENLWSPVKLKKNKENVSIVTQQLGYSLAGVWDKSFFPLQAHSRTGV